MQKKKVSGKGRRTAVHVSALTGCLRRAWYSFHAEKEPPLDYSSVCNFFMGHILHEAAPLGRRNEIKLAANIRTMKQVNPDEISPYNKYDCVVGTADDILEYEGEIVIADKKTFNGTRKKVASPDPGYIIQLNTYKLLLFITEGIEAKYGCLLYLDKANSFKDPIPFIFELDSIEKIRIETIKRLDQLKMLIPPEREITWKCNYCPFKNSPCAVPMSLVPKYSK